MRLSSLALLAALPVCLFSCTKDDVTESAPVYRHQVYNYSFNRGQVAGKPLYYNRRLRLDSMRAVLILDEKPDTATLITISLFNAPANETFPVGIHLAEDTARWGYRRTADSAIFARTMGGNGQGSVVTDTFRTRFSFDYLTKNYRGWLIVKDPVLPDTTLNIDTSSPAIFPVFGTFAR
ncbi:MAG: hypothetical protein EOP52_10850 [Sphingobacteriales bacterium]|nr:MAG: hypothetical protein EOP52_10850 [Sphingobacteriales bacterium]